MRLIIGSFGPDIHHVDFDPIAVTLKLVTKTSVGSEPSWILASKDESLLYVCDECGTYVGSGKHEKNSGAIVVFRNNYPNDKQPLTRLQTILSGGHSPTQMTFDEDERMIFVANYYEGIFSTFRILRPVGGQFGTLAAEQVIDLNESNQLEVGPNKKRQEAAHAHWIGPDALSRGKYVYGLDLGQDKIFQYVTEGSELKPNKVPFIRTRPGTGPRHMAFHPSKPWVYVLNELDSTLGVYTQDLETGNLGEERQYEFTIPPGTTKYTRSSAILMDGEAKFIYITNRDGNNSIVVYQILQDGLIKSVQTIYSGGVHPRHVAISPCGKWLSCANQKSHRIDMFARDKETGTLEWKVGLGDLNLAVFTLFLKASM